MGWKTRIPLGSIALNLPHSCTVHHFLFVLQLSVYSIYLS